MFGNQQTIKILKKIKKLEKDTKDKSLPDYKRKQAQQKLYELKLKYQPTIFHDSSKGSYIKPKIEGVDKNV